MSREVSRERPAWLVRIPAHSIRRSAFTDECYEMPRFEMTRFEESAGVAVDMAVLSLHVREALPPWRGYRRVSRQRASVERVRAVASAGRA